jgi:hypothetical protein
MAFTTSTTTFNPDLNELFEEAFERCGLGTCVRVMTSVQHGVV